MVICKADFQELFPHIFVDELPEPHRRNAVTGGTFSLGSELPSKRDIHDQGSTRVSAKVPFHASGDCAAPQ